MLLHLAMKAFYPAKPPFPLLHVDTTWKARRCTNFATRSSLSMASSCWCTGIRSPKTVRLGCRARTARSALDGAGRVVGSVALERKQQVTLVQVVLADVVVEPVCKSGAEV